MQILDLPTIPRDKAVLLDLLAQARSAWMRRIALRTAAGVITLLACCILLGTYGIPHRAPAAPPSVLLPLITK